MTYEIGTKKVRRTIGVAVNQPAAGTTIDEPLTRCFGHQPNREHVAVAMIALYMHACAAAPLALGEATTGYAKGMHEPFNGS
jgi:hypothetical protein